MPPLRRGFTLWELLCALAVAAICLGVAAPAWQRFVLDSRLAADVNAFVTAVQLARSEAVKRGRPVVVCGSADLASCGNGSYGRGWIVFVNVDDVRPPQRAAGEPLLHVYRPTLQGTIDSNRLLYEFWPLQRRSTNGTVTFCDRRGANHARAVIVSYTGRPRVAATGPNRPLTCAELS